MSISSVGGSLEANIERWRGQFQEKPEPTVQKRTVSGLEVTTVEMEGTFSAGMGGGGTPKPGTLLLGAIVRVPGAQNLIFFKAWGPKATMEKARGDFEAFVSSFRPR
jgi:hypothetical protein